MTDHSQALSDRHGPGSDELLGFLLDSMTEFAIVAFDPAGTVTGWNRGAQRLLGYREDEILGRDGDVIFTSEDRAAGAPLAERDRARTAGRAEDERWHVRKDGSRFWGSGLLMPLADHDRGFVKIMRDLTERHAAQQQLRDNEARFRLLATNIPQLVFRTRSSGHRTWGSPQWEVFTGLSLPQSVRFGWLDAVHPEDREATVAAWREAPDRREYYVEHRIRSAATGEYRWHQTRAKPVDAAGDDWVGTSTDIHDMHELQDHQKVLLAELQHRTRNLLAVVQAISRQTLRNSASLPEYAREFESRLHALSRVQGLLAHADNRSIELRAIVEAEIHAHRRPANDSDKVRLDGPRVLLLAGAAQALALAIHELATNAVKYGALKSSEGRLAILWRLEQAGGRRQLVLEWRESGVSPHTGEQPIRKGYGRELIERVLPYQLKGETRLELGPDGVFCRIAAPLPEPEPPHGPSRT